MRFASTTATPPPPTARCRPSTGNLDLLKQEGLIDDPAVLAARIRFCASLEEAVDGVDYIQESVTESLAIKGDLFRTLGEIAAPDAILASSCSSIPPEQFMSDVRHPERCLIAHPFSPPHLIPLVEIVPTRWTSPDVIARTRALMTELGQAPVTIHKPVVGFARQPSPGCRHHEAIMLVEDGVIDPADLDLCMSHGLGLRWAFLGPFETMN